MAVRCRDYIALYFFVVIAVSTMEVATAQEQLGSPSDHADHDLGVSVAVGSGDLKKCASKEFGCSVPEVLKFAEAQLHHCAPLFTAKGQVVVATNFKKKGAKGQRAILEQLGEDLDDEGEWSRSRMRVSSRGTRKTDELMLGEGGRSKLQKGGTTASSKGPLNSGKWKYKALDLGTWMKLHSQIAILSKQSAQHVTTMITGMEIDAKFTINLKVLKKMFKNMFEVDQNLGKAKKAFQTGIFLENVQAWSQSVVFVSSKAETDKAKIIAAAYDAKARAKARKASADGTHFRRAAVHGPKAADHGPKAAVRRPKDEQHESTQTQRAHQAVAKSGRRQWRHRSKARSRSASRNQGRISCVTPHGAIADCSKDLAAVKAAIKVVTKAGHKVDNMLGSSDGCETKHGDVADCSQAVSRLKGRQISQQLGEADDEFGQSLSNSRIIKGFNVKRLRRKGKNQKGKQKRKKKGTKPAAATTSATTSNDQFASCRSFCAHSYKPQIGVVKKAKATQGQSASKRKKGKKQKGLRTILKQLGEDLDGDDDDLSRSRMNSRGRRKVDELMLGEGKKKKDPFTKALNHVKQPVTEESLTKQCNDGSLVKGTDASMRQLLCSDDRSRGFGSSGCVQCQNQLCVKKNGPERCWRCSLLQQGNSLGFSCFRIAGAESTVCKSLITDEAAQPWIGCRTEKAWEVPGNKFICKGRSKKKPKKKKKELGEGKLGTATLGHTRTSPFPMFKEVQCTKAHGMQRCGVRKVNPCTHKDRKRSNMCKTREDQISLTKAF